ncbi:hypothetical protein KK083_17670 [Fulvivirgaceae bacterium PWU4]|uniref:Secreted protein n=1 Tax=Chryseosolibacter histidini TaxID=2782349 RepID=A0AAP2DLZ1_9BACT|nr:hypothetical protein [Chryseosolibacter histidini]MBT1698726.1 hypothetical protein [Chryseosolibacter histidini]
MKIRCTLAALFLLTGYFLHAQAPEHTSATDGDVRVQSPRKSPFFRYESRGKKAGSHARSTERPGQAVKKHKPRRNAGLNEAQVFRRHKHAARKGTHARRTRMTKKHSM